MQIMTWRKGVFGLFAQVLALFTALLVISMPIARVMHSHADSQIEASSKDHYHEDDNCQDNDWQCNFCEFFAHSVSREAGDVLSLSFVALAALTPPTFGYPLCEAPCDGQLQGFTNKGPPHTFLSI